MKKLVTLILTLAIFASLLLSCSPDSGTGTGGDNGGNGGNGGATNPPVADSGVLWSESLVPTIIISDQDGFNFENQLVLSLRARPSIGLWLCLARIALVRHPLDRSPSRDEQ